MEDARFRHIDFELETFAQTARRLIHAGVPFVFHISGRARDQLLPLVSGARIAEPSRLGLFPKLQPLLAILMLADAAGRAVSLEQTDKHVRFSVGSGTA